MNMKSNRIMIRTKSNDLKLNEKFSFIILGNKRSLSCLQGLFKLNKKEEKSPDNFAEDGYFSEYRNYYGDPIDGQSYESFETMTTDSECYRGKIWLLTKLVLLILYII